MFGKHTAFILPSYIATIVVIAALILWIIAVYRKHQREIANLEAKGIRRGGASAGKEMK